MGIDIICRGADEFRCLEIEIEKSISSISRIVVRIHNPSFPVVVEYVRQRAGNDVSVASWVGVDSVEEVLRRGVADSDDGEEQDEGCSFQGVGGR